MLKEKINNIRTMQAEFVKQILTEEELIDLKNSATIDYNRVLKMYGPSHIEAVQVFAFNNNRFVMYKDELSYLPDNWKDTLNTLSLQEDLVNPVFVDVEPNGQMLIN